MRQDCCDRRDVFQLIVTPVAEVVDEIQIVPPALLDFHPGLEEHLGAHKGLDVGAVRICEIVGTVCKLQVQPV